MKEPKRPTRTRRKVPPPAATADVRVVGVATSRPRRYGALFVALLAFTLYLPGLRNGFAYDAVAVVEQDERIHTLAQPARLLSSSYWAEGEQIHALYRPLVTLSFAIDWAIYGGAPWGFHLTNALAHALASALVFLLLAGLGSMPGALVGAALFAVHPVHVETVASIVGRAEIFAGCFALAALLVWSRTPPRRAAALVGTPALFLLALAAKESAIMLPALLLLFDAATGRLRADRLREWWHERAGTLAALAATAIAFLLARSAVLGTFAPGQLDPIIEVVPTGIARVRTALQIWPEIVRLLIVPWTLLADYGPRILLPAAGWTGGALAGLAFLAAAIAGGVYALRRGKGSLGLALLWVPLALLPVSNLLVPIGVILAERTLYLAVFAIALGAATAIDAIRAPAPARARAGLAIAAVVCALFAARTVSRLPAWRSTDDVFRALLRDRPDSFRAHWHHARIGWREGDADAALRHYREAIALWPYRHALVLEAGRFAVETGLPHEARDFAAQALDLWPADLVSLRRLAAVSLDLNDTVTARATVARGLRLYPDDRLFNILRDTIGIDAPSR